jgi:nitrate/nitrite transporter NarK
MSFILSYLYSLEIYETNNRVTGIGTCSAMGRLGGITMPIVSIYGSKQDLLFPYYIFCCCALISCIALMTISYETQGR